jgi:hypothetical protein
MFLYTYLFVKGYSALQEMRQHYYYYYYYYILVFILKTLALQLYIFGREKERERRRRIENKVVLSNWFREYLFPKVNM